MPDNTSPIIEVGASRDLSVHARQSAEWSQELEIYRRPSGDPNWVLIRTLAGTAETTIGGGAEDYEFQLRAYYNGWDRHARESKDQKGRKNSYRTQHSDNAVEAVTGYCDGWGGPRPAPNYEIICRRIPKLVAAIE